ncbi:MAG: pyridoxal-phosphate dependent enzyme [Cyclobacteriaceae bacterium]|nr:pyridoxal-phosphate dependent enzyme [Cyclobacteriaceae bacterium]
MITKASVTEAYTRIRPYIHRTPVMTSASIDEIAGCHVYFKCENFQKVGAFKARGAMNASLKLSRDQLSRGLATHSSGNHAQALARAAKILGVKSYIVMPRTAPEIKKRGVRSYGGEIFECEPTLEAREKTLAEVMAQTGATEIHPFNNYDVMEGQATCAMELFEDVPNLDVLIAPVGGGGLLSGTALAARYFSPTTRVMAGEPDLANDAWRSMQSGKIEPASPPISIADGLLTSLGDKTFPLIKEHVEKVMTVSEDEIKDALRLVFEKMKIVVETSCVVPFAALLKNRSDFRGKRVGIILSGGNVDLKKLCQLLG